MLGNLYAFYLTTFDAIFGKLLFLPPWLVIAILAVAFNLLSIGIAKATVDVEALGKLKARMEELKRKLAKSKKADDKLLEEAFRLNFKMLGLKAKSLILTFLAIIPFFPWLNHHYQSVAVVSLPFALPLIGSGIGWVAWYLLVSLCSSFVLARLLRCEF